MIPMVNLRGQYLKVKEDIDTAIASVVESTAFINGAEVTLFANELADYTNSRHCIPVANGTDALQIALMASGLKRGDEVIVPAFTYAAAAEVVALLGFVPVWVDVSPDTFNLAPQAVEEALTERTRAIIVVHLFGQSAPMDALMTMAAEKGLYLIEDNAQALGATYRSASGESWKTGTMGHVGCTSFFPSKNLGCFGDGGAILTQDDDLAHLMRKIANHGQEEKYAHEVLGCNSRLDTIQAAILRVKLQHLDEYLRARNNAAAYYKQELRDVSEVSLPQEADYSTHTFHQFTIQVAAKERDALAAHLRADGISSAIYYPRPLHKQAAYLSLARSGGSLTNAERLAESVLSLPIDTEISKEQQGKVVSSIKRFYKR